MGEIADFVGSTPDGGARGGEALIGVGLGVRRVFGQVAQAPGSNGGRAGGIAGSVPLTQNIHEYSIQTRGREKKKVTGARCKDFWLPAAISKKRKNTLAHIRIRALSTCSYGSAVTNLCRTIDPWPKRAARLKSTGIREY